VKVIDEILEARKRATAELIGVRADVKRLAARAAELEAAIAAAPEDRRAELAAELGRVELDRADGEALARDMLRGRRELDVKLRMLQAREGTVAAELAALESGTTPFATEGGAWDRFDDAERKIEDEAALGELGMEEIDAADRASDEVRRAGRALKAEEELEALKKKLRGE
jgi:hypothetical protein